MFGVKQIDIEDWKQNTFYKGEYADLKEKHKVVKWFWKAVTKMSEEE